MWIYLSTPHHYNQVQEDRKLTQQEAPWPDLLLLYRHHFWAFAEPGKNWMKPRRDHHELFFCVKSPTDNPCIESEAWRNNKVSVYQTHWSPRSTFKPRPATSLTKHLSERCHSGCVNVGKLRTATSLAYILQWIFTARSECTKPYLAFWQRVSTEFPGKSNKLNTAQEVEESAFRENYWSSSISSAWMCHLAHFMSWRLPCEISKLSLPISGKRVLQSDNPVL